MTKKPIYFNEEEHKYTDEFGNIFISATTLIGKYEDKFSDKQIEIARACERIGKMPHYKPRYKYLKYKGKSYKEILKEWQAKSDKGCEIGNKKHNYLESSVKSSSGFYSVFKSKYSNKGTVRLYTVEDILEDHNFGTLDLDYFIRAGVQDKYPAIFNVIASFVREGWKIYSEIGVFDFELHVSGLVDILFVKDGKFVILDWKTNRDLVRFEGGYWEHDDKDNTVGYLENDKTFKYPMNRLPHSTGNKYSLQLSLYARLIEGFGLEFVSLILAHILHNSYTLADKEVQSNPDWVGKNKVVLMPMPYLKQDINNMLGDYSFSRNKGQTSISA